MTDRFPIEGPIPIRVTVGDEAFEFPLYLRREPMGSVLLDHYWIDKKQVYGQSDGQPNVLKTLANCYYALCNQVGALQEREAQQTYLMVLLIPRVRSKAGRNVFLDSRLGMQAIRNREEMGRLEMLLQSNHAMTPAEFHKQTSLLCEPRTKLSGALEQYTNLENYLFEKANTVFQKNPGAALKSSIARWNSKQRSWAKSSGKEERKALLDAFSYDCRAALHRVYSTIWRQLLIPEINRVHKLSRPSEWFLRFWHREFVRKDLSLFHGHVFGLHPGSSLLMRTDNGKRLMADWLTNLRDSEPLLRVLRGIYVCVNHYHDLYETTRSDRKKRPESESDIEEVHARQAESRWGRRKAKRRKSDAR